MKRKLVVVGAGMASGRLLEQFFKTPRGAYDITLFGAEPRGNYSRIMLSSLLAGEANYQEIVTHNAAWYAAHNVACRFGETVTGINRAAKCVRSRNGETPYDKLVLATGSAPFVIPVAGKELHGVLSFRDLDDVNAMLAVAGKAGAQAVVLGGGLLGLEAAAGLNARGMRVVVLHLMDHLMERQLNAAAGLLLQKELEQRGIKVHCRAQTTAILGHRRAEAVLLDDGTIYPADLVVMATGIRPETRIATDAGLHVERGIVVDDQMRTSDPDILAVGECVEHRGICYGLIDPVYDMIGPGTGVAPFRAFLQERRAIGAGGRNWLFFGHQHSNFDFFYEDEFKEMKASGLLTRLSLAWSRDGTEKIYVQDRMREVGRDLWSWLADGAHIYVCGDAKRMAKDVEIAVVDIVAQHGARSPEDAAAFVANLKKKGRYQQDVY